MKRTIGETLTGPPCEGAAWGGGADPPAPIKPSDDARAQSPNLPARPQTSWRRHKPFSGSEFPTQGNNAIMIVVFSH